MTNHEPYSRFVFDPKSLNPLLLGSLLVFWVGVFTAGWSPMALGFVLGMWGTVIYLAAISEDVSNADSE